MHRSTPRRGAAGGGIRVCAAAEPRTQALTATTRHHPQPCLACAQGLALIDSGASRMHAPASNMPTASHSVDAIYAASATRNTEHTLLEERARRGLESEHV